jgi:hypothetical protein
MRPVRCRLSRVIFGRSTKRPATGSKSLRGARQGQQERSTTLNARIDRSTAAAAAPRTQLRSLAGAILTIFVAAFVLTPAGTRTSGAAPDVSVIVRTLSGAQARIERFVTSEGGSITAELPIIDGFSATLSQRVADAIGADPSVVSIPPDVALAPQASAYDPGTDTNSMASTTKYSGATAWWRAGYTGDGVDVALIDTGVAPVTGLDGTNKVIYGPDLSIESQSPALTNLDTYGHGTFMAGLIAGNDPTLTAPYDQSPPSAYRGMAPDAWIVSLKVGTADGGTDVSQVIAAIDWVVQHANDPGMNIRVLNLSYGTNSVQPYTVDPLAYAAEVAWKQGIVVVAAGGNYGFQSHMNTSPPSRTLPSTRCTSSPSVRRTRTERTRSPTTPCRRSPLAQAWGDAWGRHGRSRDASPRTASPQLLHRHQSSRGSDRHAILPWQRYVPIRGDRLGRGGARSGEVPERNAGSGQGVAQ